MTANEVVQQLNEIVALDEFASRSEQLVDTWITAGYGKGYDALLIESIRRKPTAHTAWMLNRLINGAKDGDARARVVVLMREARAHPLADKSAVETIESFLEDL